MRLAILPFYFSKTRSNKYESLPYNVATIAQMLCHIYV